MGLQERQQAGLGCVSGLQIDEMLPDGAGATESRPGRQYQVVGWRGCGGEILLGQGRRRPTRRAQERSAAAQGPKPPPWRPRSDRSPARPTRVCPSAHLRRSGALPSGLQARLVDWQPSARRQAVAGGGVRCEGSACRSCACRCVVQRRLQCLRAKQQRICRSATNCHRGNFHAEVTAFLLPL